MKLIIILTSLLFSILMGGAFAHGFESDAIGLAVAGLSFAASFLPMSAGVLMEGLTVEQELTKIAKDLSAKNVELADQMEKANENIKNVGEEHTETKEAVDAISVEITEMTEKLEKAGERYDDLEGQIKTALETGNKKEIKNLGSQLKELFASEEGIAALKTGALKSHDLGFKAGDMTQGNTFTGDVVEPQRIAGVVFDPNRKFRIRQLLTQGSANVNSVAHINESAFDDGTATRAEGAQMAQSDFDHTLVTTNASHISAFMNVTREMLEDATYIESYLRSRLGDKYMDEEDAQLLDGDGTGTNISGLITNATAYTDFLAESSVNRYDVLGAGTVLIDEANFQTTAILLHPRDRFLLMKEKDDDGAYQYPNDIRNGGTPNVMGVPIFTSNEIAIDTFLIGDFPAATMLFDRRNMTIEMWMQDGENAKSREVTFTINGSIILPIYKSTAMITGTFVNALATGSA